MQNKSQEMGKASLKPSSEQWFHVIPTFQQTASLTAVSKQNGRISDLLGGSVEVGTAGAFRSRPENFYNCSHNTFIFENSQSNI